MNDHDEIEHLLPTKGARWTVVLTSLLLTPAFQAPVFLKPFLWTTATEKYISLLQIIATILVLLVGSFITLYLVVRAYNELIKKHEKEIAKITISPPPPPTPIEYKRKYLA